MTTQSTILFGVLLGLAVALTFLAIKVRFLPVRLAASVAWLVPGVWLLTANTTGFEFSSLWVQALGFLFLLMVFVPLLMQIVVETKVKTKSGGEYTTFKKVPKEEPKVPQSKINYQNRRQVIRDIVTHSKNSRG